MESTVNISFYIGSNVSLFQEVDGSETYDTYSLNPDVMIKIVFDAVLVGTNYQIFVNDTAGAELFRRTFLEEELDERDWYITITPEGIW